LVCEAISAGCPIGPPLQGGDAEAIGGDTRLLERGRATGSPEASLPLLDKTIERASGSVRFAWLLSLVD